MTKVQQRALALLGLVALDNSHLHFTRPRHGTHTRRHIACSHRGAHVFKPIKERRITKQAVFHDLAIPRQEIARRKRTQQSCIGQYKRRLMKRPDQVLAMRRVDPSFTPNRAVDLRKQRRWNLHEPDTTAQNCGRKPNQITNHTAAKGNDNIAAFDFLIQQPFNRALQLRPALCCFTSRQ